ncbi:MAG TPA: hypothetical protein VLD37_01660 [Candidatus Bilamarchaeum sp.]|nr:hypothetical protein [Candidatus Bilamarchaeum sp.]
MSAQATLRPFAGEAMPGISGEISRFKLQSERVRLVEPDSREWRSLAVGERLEGIPFVESMIRGGKAALALLPEPTRSCREKAKVAGIGMQNIVKTLCCMEMANPEGRLFLVTSTSAGRMNLTDICCQHEDLRYEGLVLAAKTLPSMAPGTCTPFVPDTDVAGVERFFVQAPEGGLGDRMVDVSIGGTDEIAFRLSVSLKYRELVSSLSDAYGEKMRLFSRDEEPDAMRLPGRIEEQLRVLRGDPRHPKRYAPRLKAIKRLESLVESRSLGKMERALVISELHMTEGEPRVVQEAAALASRMAKGMETDS